MVSGTTSSLTASHRYVIEIVLDLGLNHGRDLDESWEAVLQFLWNLERSPAIDRALMEHLQSVYLATPKLPQGAFIHYCVSICAISTQELALGGTQTIDRIAKIVILNLDRDVDTILQMWAIVRMHFVQVAFASARPPMVEVVNERRAERRLVISRRPSKPRRLSMRLARSWTQRLAGKRLLRFAAPFPSFSPAGR